MPRCLFCDEIMEETLTWSGLFLKTEAKKICENCEAKLERIEGDRCTICSRKLDEKFREEHTCLDCVKWERDREWSGVLTKNISLFHYNDFLKETIAKYKYRGDYALAEAFVPFLRSQLKELEFDVVTYIPLSQERLKERGFNQAKALADMLGLQTIDSLSRIHSEKQSKKSRMERMKRTQVFQWTGTEDVQNQTVLILDDIYTTGATLRQAAKVLKEMGANKVVSLTIAR